MLEDMAEVSTNTEDTVVLTLEEFSSDSEYSVASHFIAPQSGEEIFFIMYISKSKNQNVYITTEMCL